jgi:hypothetical protein
LGQGIGFALTHAANISWDLRSASTGGASPAAAVLRAGSGGVGAAGVGGTEALAAVPMRTDERRPHCGQTARLPDPVAWSETWQLGQSVFNPEGVKIGAGAGGGRIALDRVFSGTAGAGGVGGAGTTRAHRTVRRAGS